MHDPGDDTVHQPTETLRAGPTRPPLLEKVPLSWRRRALAPLAFVLGVALGAAAALWWQGRPESTPSRPAAPPFRVDEHAIELLLFQAEPPTTRPGVRKPGVRPLQVDSALLLTGAVTSSVSTIGTIDGSLDVLAPALPVTVSPSGRLQPVRLRIVVRDCRTAARRWVSGDRRFTLTWRDEFGKSHLDRAGDFGRPVATALTRYVDSVCDKPRR